MQADDIQRGDLFTDNDSMRDSGKHSIFDNESWNQSYARLGESREGPPLGPGMYREVSMQEPYTWDQYPDGTLSRRLSRTGGLQRTKSVGEYSDVPSTAHSIAIDSVVGDMAGRSQSRVHYENEDSDTIPLHMLGKRNVEAEPHDQYVDPDPEIDPEEDSPYPEVRASVSNIDDPNMPVMTIRMWFLALFLSCLGGAVNTFLSLRFPSPMLSPVALQLLAYFLGKFLAFILPIDEYYMPWWLGGFRFTLNPGAFNIKEHALITIMINITISQAYAINFLLVSELPHYYNSPVPAGFEFIIALSSQVIGFGFAGYLHRFLVWPADMVWPQTLLTSTILNTLHAEEEKSDNSMTRLNWFAVTGVGACLYNFVPNGLFNALSQMCWACWIAKGTCFG